MRGVKSFAMVLCVGLQPLVATVVLFTHVQQATSKDGKDAGIELIQPPPGSKPGERVYFEGSEFESMQHPLINRNDLTQLSICSRNTGVTVKPEEENIRGNPARYVHISRSSRFSSINPAWL